MQKSAYKRPLNLELSHNCLGLYFYRRLEKCLKVIENVKEIKFEEDWAKLGPKSCFLNQSHTKYFE